MVMNTSLPLPGLDELAQFSTRAAKAAALLSEVRDEDVDVAATPREEVHRIGGRTLYRIALDGPKRVATPVLVIYAMVGRWTILDLQAGPLVPAQPRRGRLRGLHPGLGASQARRSV